jgi:preprotein translocase subunit SecA
VLNARQDQEEAEVVARAGEPGRITVATNMAGRGTDIRLAPGVAEIGGLHVLSTVRHDSRRIDRQLFGRCGRQGDPGSYQVVISLEDEIFHSFFKHRIAAVRKLFPHAGKPLPAWLGDRLVGYAQNAAERHHGRIRRDLLRSDDQLSDMLAFAGRSE